MLSNARFSKPTIKAKIQKDWDKIIFLNFTRRGGVIKRKILRAHPELEGTLATSKNKATVEKAISKYVDQLYSQHRSQLEAIVEKEGKTLDETAEAIFSGLEETMGCDWSAAYKFLAIPTFLPINPFGKSCFYFSVYDEIIQGKPSRRRVDRIAIHELSHICWYRKLEKIYKELDFRLNEAANYYLKEAIAPVIGECDEFSEINGGFSPANKNVSLLRVRIASEEMGFVEFFRKLFKKRRAEGLDFDTFLVETLKIGHSIQGVLEEKMSIWNRYGDDLNKLHKERYKTSIKLPAEIKSSL